MQKVKLVNSVQIQAEPVAFTFTQLPLKKA